MIMIKPLLSVKITTFVWLNWSRIHVDPYINVQAANCFYLFLS